MVYPHSYTLIAMKKFIFTLSALALLILSQAVQAAIPSHMLTQITPSLAPMLQKIMPAVVNIKIQGNTDVATSPDTADAEPSENNAPTRRFEGLGSGVIVDAAHGYILTNAHVVRRAKTIMVTLSDGRAVKAKLIGLDAPSDIALLQVKEPALVELPWGNSDLLKVGDFVAAIGNPFGLSQTVTSGIVSALQRSGLGIEGYESFIQTDASINPGNSGGALINLRGELVGINTAILGPAGGSIGIGFAIPANMARGVMVQLIKFGSVRRGLMGVLVQDFTPELANAFHIASKTGALITMVNPGSPAEKAGIKPGDIIQKINGEAVRNGSQVRNMVGLLRVGSKISVELLRQNKPIKLSLTTQDPDQYAQATEAQNPFLFGTILKNFDQQLPLQGHVVGVLVLRVAQNTAAWHAGLRPGDVIVSANQKPIHNLPELNAAMPAFCCSSAKQLLLNVMRQNGALFVVINR